jgi:alcohol dehydrogenase
MFMHTRAAILHQNDRTAPYTDSQPLTITDVELDAPGPGEVLVQIVAAGLCHSDLSVINGNLGPYPLPIVLGHEASGIVQEIGSGVSDLQKGDHVVFSFVPTCGHCLSCATGRPSLCTNGSRANGAGTLLSGAIRFHTNDGQHISHFLGVAAFSEYTVAAQESLIKIDPSIPLDKAALFSCGILTGVGAVINTAKVEAGEPVVIFGLGGVGLSTIMGAKLVGASPIIAVDVLPSKFELAKRLGADHTLQANSDTLLKSIRKLTDGGAAYAFDAVGNVNVLAQAFNATRVGGTTIAVGLDRPDRQLAIPAIALVAQEKTLRGSFMGSAVPRRDIPRLINLYQSGKLPIDELISPSLTLNQVNTGFDRLAQGSAIRQLIHFS